MKKVYEIVEYWSEEKWIFQRGFETYNHSRPTGMLFMDEDEAILAKQDMRSKHTKGYFSVSERQVKASNAELNLAAFKATAYYQKYEPLIDLAYKMAQNTVTFYVNNRYVEFSIKFNAKSFRLTGDYFDEELENGFEKVKYGTFKTLEEVSDYLINDHIEMEIDECLAEVLAE